MTTALDTKIRPKVVEILAAYGKSITWTVSTGGTYIPTTGAVSGATETPYTVKASPPFPYESKYIDGDIVRAGDALLYLAGQGLAFTPSEGQKATIDGATWKAVRVNAIYSGDLIAAWEVQVRR